MLPPILLLASSRPSKALRELSSLLDVWHGDIEAVARALGCRPDDVLRALVIVDVALGAPND